ncbi:uncharacterized protein [Rutidosis leptorrhynchoides]|uniref:uncharacterized protein n=1 Tax=Rutidosis leptorrhynchoides TaxID=125765 RepID=UPI003A98CECD
MGLCTSRYTGSTATTNVKLILLDGQLREFRSPVKVFMVVHQPHSFICNADEMDYNEYVTAMSQQDELQPGQLYFELPSSWLNKRLTVEDMRSSAVKAIEALMVNDGKVRCGCWVKPVNQLVFCDEDKKIMSSCGRVEGGGSGGDDLKNHRCGGGGKGRFVTRLGRIVE